MPSAEVWTAGSSLGARIVEVVRPNRQRRGMVLLVQCWYTVVVVLVQCWYVLALHCWCWYIGGGLGLVLVRQRQRH